MNIIDEEEDSIPKTKTNDPHLLRQRKELDLIKEDHELKNKLDFDKNG